MLTLKWLKPDMLRSIEGRHPPRDFNMVTNVNAENEAKINNIGMWSLGDKYVSPKKWRKKYIRKAKAR